MNPPIAWGQTFRVALWALSANKVRTLLTMLGVIIGSACVVLVITISLTGKRYVVSQIESVGANLIYGELQRVGPLRLADQINPGDLEAIQKGVPQVVRTAGTYDVPMNMMVAGKEYLARVVGVTRGFREIRRLVVLRGRYLDEDDMMTGSKVCLLTDSLASLLYPNENPVGHVIRVGELYFTVIGVFRERVATFGLTELTSDALIVPFSLIKVYTGSNYFKSFCVQAANYEFVPGVTVEVAEVLRSRHRPGAVYRVENLTGLIEAVKKISVALTALLLLFAFLTLGISGVGIMNIMLVSVKERTTEIGLRRAVGAPRVTILHQFLMEAMLISGTGALAGIAIALFILAPVNEFIRSHPEIGDIRISISWISLLVAFLVSCSTGLFFGYLPANRAAQLQPTESLRHE
ncbi:MAG TPA: ABC transporter permease [Candidatus Acidoferrales bacterium]|nr:ABC transporter permease [Candidatus Acidoferrales bacterium]